MNLKQFIIINSDETQQTEGFSPILLNLEQIVSVKPIKLRTKDSSVVDGYWLRLTNGKKYRAVQVPQIILDCFNERLPAMAKSQDDQQPSGLGYQ